MRRLLLAFLFLPAAAVAQSVPNGGSISAGQVWTASQWTNAWQSKMDVGAAAPGTPGSSFNTTFPGTGTAIGVKNSGNMVNLNADNSGNLLTSLGTPLPQGANTIGFVNQGGSWIVGITGTVPLPNGAAQNQYTGAFYNSTSPTLLNGQQTPLQVDANGNLKVNVVTGGGSGGGGGGTSSQFGSAFPASGTAIGVKNSGNMTNLTADNSGNLNIDLQTALPAGTNVIGGVTQSGTWTVGVGTPLPTGTNTIGAVNQNGTWTVQLSGGVPLPTGAATSANQTATQGSVAGGTAGTSSDLVGGTFRSTAPTLTNGQQAALQLDASGNLKVNIASGGGSGGTSSSFNTSFPSTGTAIGALRGGNMVSLAADGSGNLNVDLQTPIPAGTNTIGAVTQSGTWSINLPTGASTAANQTAVQGSAVGGNAATASELVGGVYNSAAPTLTSGQQAAAQLDASGNLKVNIVAGAAAGGTSSTFAAAFPSTGTAMGAKNGSNMVNLTADGSSNLNVNCVVGCSGGTASNATSAVATSSTNGQTLAFGYAFNGTTWDQLQDDASKNLKVNLATALPAGSNVVGGVTQSGTWNVTNISGTVSLPTGAATAANQTSVIGTVAAGTAASNAMAVGGVYNSTQPSPTSGQGMALQVDGKGNLRTNQGSKTIVALDVSSVTTGGTAVTALTAGHRTAGGWILNPSTATVNLCINEISTASGTTSAGSTTCIVPGQTYTLAPSANAVSVIASDSSHAFSGYGFQ